MLGLGSILQLCKTEHLENPSFRAVSRHTQSYYHSRLQWHWSALRLIRFSPSSCTIFFLFFERPVGRLKVYSSFSITELFQDGPPLPPAPAVHLYPKVLCGLRWHWHCGKKRNSFKNIFVQKLEKSCNKNTQQQQLGWRLLDCSNLNIGTVACKQQ